MSEYRVERHGEYLHVNGVRFSNVDGSKSAFDIAAERRLEATKFIACAEFLRLEESEARKAEEAEVEKLAQRLYAVAFVGGGPFAARSIVQQTEYFAIAREALAWHREQVQP